MTNTAQPTKQCPGCQCTTMSGFCTACLPLKATTHDRLTTEAAQLGEPAPAEHVGEDL